MLDLLNQHGRWNGSVFEERELNNSHDASRLDKYLNFSKKVLDVSFDSNVDSRKELYVNFFNNYKHGKH